MLFLGCGDPTSSLTTVAACNPDLKLNIHINDISLPIIARNILILKIVFDEKFDANNPGDLNYLWDVWYNATWSEETLHRFVKDVTSLIDDPLPVNILIPERKHADDLKKLWKKWILFINNQNPVEGVLASRYSLALVIVFIGPSLFKHVSNSFPNRSEVMAVGLGTNPVAQGHLFSDISDSVHALIGFPSLMEKLGKELEQYCQTGNCGMASKDAACANPTLLNHVSRKWNVPFDVTPFDGYLPLVSKELDQSDDAAKNGILLGYCQKELKKLLNALRKRIHVAKFYLHLGDPLEFCFQLGDSEGFDLISTSDLADRMGLANLLVAAARKLRSSQSVLLTTCKSWVEVASDVPQYVEATLCCPLSLVPTMYGLRLMDNVELGPETLRFVDFPPYAGFQLRWKKCPPFNGIQLALSPPLKESLRRLRDECFALSIATPPSWILRSERKFLLGSGMVFYSPLTFFYVLSDLMRRGGMQEASTVLPVALSGLPPVFQLHLETLLAWRERRPIRWVHVIVPFNDPMSKQLAHLKDFLLLRLVLVDKIDLDAIKSGDSSLLTKLLKLNSKKSHFIDNFEFTVVPVPTESLGVINCFEIKFLLGDCSLLETHGGLVVDRKTGHPFIYIEKFSDELSCVEPFTGSYPWPKPPNVPPSELSCNKVQHHSDVSLCFETKGGYFMDVKIPSKKRQGNDPSSSIKRFLLQQHRCLVY